MITEEKAKAYDEALEKAKSMIDDLRKGEDILAVSDLESMFPELKESEDEKIRKVLVDMVNRETGFTGFPSQGQVLAYLEKQKEPDGTWTEEDDAKVKVMCKEGDLKPSERAWLKELKNRIVKKEQKPVHTAKEMWKEMRLEVYAQASGNRHEPNYSDDSTKMFSLCDIDEIFEKIGDSTVESQPVEWSDTDMKEARDNIISACRDWERGEQTTFLPIAAARARYFLEHLTEPKQEWSEEDNRNYEYLHQVICNYINNPQIEYKEREKASKELIPFWERLKSLSPQPKVEWSEEDKHRCKDAIYFLETAKKHYASTSEIELTIEWLKSLQPQATQEQKEQTTLEYLPKKKINDIISKLTNLSFRKLIPYNSKEYRKIKEIRTDVRDLLDYPIEQKPAEWVDDVIRKGIKEVGLTQYQIDWLKSNVFSLKNTEHKQCIYGDTPSVERCAVCSAMCDIRVREEDKQKEG